MSSVSGPTDGGYGFYKARLEDLEEDLKNEYARAKAHEKERTETLVERQKEVLQKRDAELERTVENNRQNAADTLNRTQENQRYELNRVKEAMYDRFGRSSAESEALRNRLESVQKAGDARAEADKRNLTNAEEIHRNRIEESNKAYREQLENSVKTTRDSAREGYEKTAETQKSVHEDLKTQAEKRYEELSRRKVEELDQAKKTAEKEYAAGKANYDRQMKKMNNDNDFKTEVIIRNYEDRAKKNAKRSSDEHAADMARVKFASKELMERESQYVGGKSQGHADAIAENEQEWRERERRVVDSYEQQVNKLRDQAQESDKHFAVINDEALRNKDKFFSDVIRKGNIEHQKEKDYMHGNFRKGVSQVEKQLVQEREHSLKTLERQGLQANDQQTRALENQAKTNQETMSDQRARNDSIITGLEQDLQKLKTTGDPTMISPTAEAHIRETTTKEFNKTFDAERERNLKNEDSIQKSYAERYRDLAVDSQSKETQLRRQNITDLDAERANFAKHTQDLEYAKEEALRHKNYEATKQTENMNRAYARILEKQKRNFDEIMQNSRSDASAKYQSAINNAEFKEKINQRAFSAKQSELIREYDKKLADQKEEYEVKFDDLKTQTQQTIREEERKNRQLLEEQTRTYEQKLAQTESQHKEHERALQENFSEQLEKVRRSHAILSKKS